MKLLIGLLLIVAGLILGLYMGLWVMCIGGIIQIVQGIRAPEADMSMIAFGLLKFFLADLVGFLSAILLILPGVAMIQDS